VSHLRSLLSPTTFVELSDCGPRLFIPWERALSTMVCDKLTNDYGGPPTFPVDVLTPRPRLRMVGMQIDSKY
jgi:hypothetical protein